MAVPSRAPPSRSEGNLREKIGLPAGRPDFSVFSYKRSGRYFCNMATSIQNNLLEYYFSSQLPDLRWQTDEEVLTVSLYCPIDGIDILELTLTAVGGYVDLQEVRDAVERKMRYLNKDQIYLQVRWKVPSARIYNISGGCNVYYCVKSISESCSAWLQSHFLTTLKSKPLPGSGSTEQLYFVNPTPLAVTTELLVTCRLSSGLVRVVDVPDFFEEIPVATTLVRSLSWNLNDVMAAAGDVESTVEEVLAVTIRVGSRLMTYYKPAVRSTAVFVFTNAFGVHETARLNCVTTKKTKDERKVAHVAHRAKVYDLDPQVTYETETCPLPLEVADWLSQLVTAPYAWLGDGTPILVTDGESSISDDAAVMNTVKFTWQRDDARDALDVTAADVNIFVKPPFAHQFD